MRFFVILLLLVGACANEDTITLRFGAQTRQIDPIDLKRRSVSAPVSVDQAVQPADLQPTTAASQTQSSSPDQLVLTLNDIRAAALANNLDLRVELLNPDISQQLVDAERAKFESTFFANGKFARQGASSRSDQQDYTAGLAVPLRTGGVVSLIAPLSRTENGSTDNTAGLGFSISQPLLRNAGVRVNEYSIHVVEYQKQVVDAQTKLNAIRILANADRAYWALYASRGALDVNRRVYELALKQVDQARKRVAAQASPRIEITRAESGAASRLESILVSQTIVQQRQRELKRIMNRPDLPVDSNTEIVPGTQPNPLGLDLSPQLLASNALANRMEMLELELQLAADAETIDFEKNQSLPLFTLDYDYTLSRSNSRFSRSLDLTHDGDSDWSIQLRGEIPIGNAAARARVLGAILQRIQRLGTREQRRIAITQEVYDALDQLKQDWQRILAARNEAVLAGRTYEAEQRQFELGVRTSTDVLDAAARLASAQLREVQAIADYEISQIDIAFATGTLLGQNGVLLSPIPVTH